MTVERDELLAVALRDYEERSSAGAPPPLVEYRARLGDAWDDFVQILDTEAELMALLEPVPEPPLGGLFGPYELLRLLGRGATGLVYEARNTANNRIEAVKILRPGLESDPDLLRRFRQEVHLAQTLDHDNMVRVHACGEIGGYPYCAMELVEGMTLRDAQLQDTLPTKEALCRGLAGVADALQALHDRDIVHRDVKPSNIVVRPDGTMVLADFGLARAADLKRITWTGQMLGTPRYMSPQQIRGEDVDPRADVYGLGATLYRLLSGRPLYDAETVAALALKVLQERPESLVRVAPDVPAALGGIVMKAVEQEPDDRHASAAELRDELLAFADGGTPRSRPVSLPRRLARRARRCWLPLSLAAAVLVAAVTAVTLYLGRDARLDLEVLPVASVTLNGEKQQGHGSRVELRTGPGTWRIHAEREGFLPLDFERELSAGQEDSLRRVLVVADANDRDAALALREALNAHAVLGYDSSRRGHGEDRAVPVFPRKKVRLEDLDRFRVELDVVALDDGEVAEIAFYKNATELWVRPLLPDVTVVDEKIPPAVLAALKPGDTVVWGVATDDERWQTAFTVASISKEAAGRWSLVEDLAKDQPEGIRAWLRGSFLVSEGFHQAALQEMRRRGGKQSGLPPWVVAREALGRLQLEGTTLDDEIYERINAFPRTVRGPWEKGPRLPDDG